MKSSPALSCVVCVLLAGQAAGQVIECWDLGEFTTAELVTSDPGPVSVMVVPDGSGDRFAEAQNGSGQMVDATIVLYLRDCDALPIASFPAEDLWLETVDGGLVPCMGGATADSDTDTEGRTTFSQPLRAGGMSAGEVLIMVSGLPAIWPPYLPLMFNSPDLNADHMVNLSDLAVFAGDFYGDYQYRSDLFHDGVINLIDLVRMAGAFGANCP